MESKPKEFSRREFLKTSAIGLGASVVGFGCASEASRSVATSEIPTTIAEAGRRLRDGSPY